MRSKSHLPWTLAALGLIGTVVFLAYAPALQGGFVYDDPLLILDNPLVTDPDIDLLYILRRPYFGAGGGGSGFYRPLMPLIFRMEYRLFGNRPFGYHLDNLLIHCGVCFLLHLLLMNLGAPRGGALAAALLFAAHPATTESIAWISGRTDPLSFLFMGLALVLFCRVLRHTGNQDTTRFPKWTFLLSLCAYLAALFVKEIAFIFPVTVLILVLRWPGNGAGASSPPSTRRTFWTFGAYAAMMVLALAIGRLLPRGEAAELFQGRGGVWERGLTFLSLVPAYMGKIFWPQNLSLARPVSLAATVLDLRVIGGTLIVLASVVLLILGFRKRNLPLAVGAALFLPALLAHSNLVPIAYGFREMDFPFFERYLYIPLAGLLMILAGLLPQKTGRLGAAVPLAVALVLCLFIGKATRDRSRVWQDNTTLFLTSLEAYPDSPTLSFNLGQAFFDSGKLLEAKAAFHRAHYLDPDMVMALVHEAVVLADLGQFDEAEKMLLETVEKHPQNGQAREALGFIYAQAGRWGEALEHYARAALLLDGVEATAASRDEAARRLKAETEMLYLQRKDYPAVLARADLALEWLPDCAWAHEARGLALYGLGEEDAAIPELERAVALDETQSVLALSKLARIYRDQGRFLEAEELAGKLEKILERLPPPEVFRKGLK